MTLQLYAHPFSSYCQKVLTALYENATPFSWRLLEFGDEAVVAEFAALWPIQRMPVLLDGERKVAESSTIIEYLGQRYPGPVRLIPADVEVALEARFMDRVFDNYVMTPMQKIVFDRIRSPEHRDAYGVDEARRLLDRAYGWTDSVMAQRTWAAGEAFTLADCAAGPSLFFADWVHPIPEQFASLRAYRARLLARPSFARAVNEARPFRPIFPGGAPDRD
jgi:glutathione S-transferase